MLCPYCHYVMTSFDAECPRCHGKGLPGNAPSQPQGQYALPSQQVPGQSYSDPQPYSNPQHYDPSQPYGAPPPYQSYPSQPPYYQQSYPPVPAPYNTPYQQPPLPYPGHPGYAPVPQRQNNKIAAGICGIFFGGLGIHKFILGYGGEGAMMLIFSLILGPWLCFIPSIIIGLIGFIEGIIYLCKNDEDFMRTYVYGKRGWF